MNPTAASRVGRNSPRDALLATADSQLVLVCISANSAGLVTSLLCFINLVLNYRNSSKSPIVPTALSTSKKNTLVHRVYSLSCGTSHLIVISVANHTQAIGTAVTFAISRLMLDALHLSSNTINQMYICNILVTGIR